MAKTKISEWDSNPNNNTDIDSINIAEGCAPSGINNAIRELMSQVKDFQQGTYSDPFNGPINGTVGATTPSTGAFTTLSASGNVTLSGGTANGVAYLNGSKVVTTGSALTFDGTTFKVNTGSQFLTNGAGANADFEIAGNGNTAGSASFLLRQNTSNQALVYNRANADMLFGIASAEIMRLTSTGLGIGTSSPSTKLHVAGSIRSGVDGSDSLTAGANVQLVNAAGTRGSILQLNAANGLAFWSNGAGSWAQTMTLDSSGNLGLGVTPSAWGSDRKILQLGGATYTYFAGNGIANIVSNNVYVDSGGVSRYLQSYAAGLYQQNGNGDHYWYTAPSGTAGNAISFTQAMTLDASGNLLVGTTNSVGAGGFSLLPNNSAGAPSLITNRSATAAVSTVLQFRDGGTPIGSISHSNTSTAFNTSSDYRLKENIQPMTGALTKVAALKPCTYKWKADGSDGEGFIAHELAEVVPQCVTGEKDAVDAEGKPVYQGIDTSFLVATLTAALQELMAEVNSLKAEIQTLKGN